MIDAISFPNLGITLNHVGKSFQIFGFEIAFYGIIIGIAMVCGVALAMEVARRTKQDPEFYFDLAMIAIFTSLIGARIYYVVFSWDLYKGNLWEILDFRSGGLAIYGGIIAGVLTAYLVAKWKKKRFFLVADTACTGLILGQIIGRWGNFFNREAFGDYTNNLLAMRLPIDAVRGGEVTQNMMDHLMTIEGVNYIQVHPTFLYESLWNLGVLIFLLWYTKRKKFEGEVFWLYLMGYGLGRMWIEGLRTDQLLFPVLGFPVSQALAGFLVLVSLTIIVWKRIQLRKQKRAGSTNE
ncbi:MAG: prolipoprotein diacylglyceryl transferase [Lachnospiraceae bacterium]|nr:prolipoprotein diacylglyceryl transferase [Robinsoniella sp.]MDY3767219.1 prolipoprotein diacylglyceryl transferase [Lachnospiraceae bacterium]